MVTLRQQNRREPEVMLNLEIHNIDRQVERERTSLAKAASDRDLAAHRFDQLPDDGKA